MSVSCRGVFVPDSTVKASKAPCNWRIVPSMAEVVEGGNGAFYRRERVVGAGHDDERIRDDRLTAWVLGTAKTVMGHRGMRSESTVMDIS